MSSFALEEIRCVDPTPMGYIPIELMYGQKVVMPIEHSIVSWAAVPWASEVSREELLMMRIRPSSISIS